MPCDICCNKYMYDIVKYNCGHTFHKKCLLVNNMSLINPMCIKCKIGKKFTVKKYEDDASEDYSDSEDDSDEDDSDDDETRDLDILTNEKLYNMLNTLFVDEYGVTIATSMSNISYELHNLNKNLSKLLKSKKDV